MNTASRGVGDDGPFEESLGFLLSRLKGRMGAVLDEELAGTDITHAQWIVIVRIANGMASTGAELSRCLGADTGSMTRMIDRLEEKHLIVRERSAEDRRVITLQLTPEGREKLPDLLAAGRRTLERMMAGFTRDEIDVVRATLLRMLANLGVTELTT